MTVKDKEFYDRIAGQIGDSIRAKNRVKVSEFARYEPLFDSSIRNGNLEEKHIASDLIKEYQTRFSLHHPIEIVAEDGKTIVEVLPPMMTPVPPINGVVTKSAELINTFTNIMGNPNHTEQKKQQIASTVAAAVSVTLARDENFKTRKDFSQKIVDKFDKKKEKKASPMVTEEASRKTKGMEWD